MTMFSMYRLWQPRGLTAPAVEDVPGVRAGVVEWVLPFVPDEREDVWPHGPHSWLIVADNSQRWWTPGDCHSVVGEPGLQAGADPSIGGGCGLDSHTLLTLNVVSREREPRPAATMSRRWLAAVDRRGFRHQLKPLLIGLLETLGIDHGLTPDPTIFRELRRLRRTLSPAAEGPRVLVVSFRGGWLLHAAWEALIAAGLRRRGATLTLFGCSGGIPSALPDRGPACGISNIHVNRPLSCPDCVRCGRKIAGALHLPVLRLDELLAPSRMREVLRGADGYGVGELLRLEHRGLLLGPSILRAARWFLCCSQLDDSEESLVVLRGFARTALLLAEVAPLLLDRVSPDVVFLLNGLFLVEDVIRAEAARRGIRVVTYERGQDPDSLCFSEGVANYFDLDPLWAETSEIPLSAEQEERLTAYIEERRTSVWPELQAGEADIRRTLNLDPDCPTAALFTNVTWDSAAQDRDRGFRDMFSWVVDSVRLFASRPETQLVIRVHPAEVRIRGRETRDPVLPRLETVFPSLPPNVRLIPPESTLSSYALMRLARSGLVYTSTIGLEMAMEGMPVVVAGQVHYAGKGFTLDTRGPDDYARVVADALERPRNAATGERAQRYGYAFFFRGNHPFPLASENAPGMIPSLNTTDPSSLDPGGDRTLDLVCDRILSGGNFYAAG